MPFGQSRLFPCRTPSQTVVCQPLRGHMCASVTATRHEVPRFTPTPSVHTASSRKLAPLWRRRPAYWRLFVPRFAERNTNCVKMQTDPEIPADTKNHPYGVKSFPQLFSPQITDETARKPARIMRRGFQHMRVRARAQTASAHVGASCTHTRAASRRRVKPSRHDKPRKARFASSRQAASRLPAASRQAAALASPSRIMRPAHSASRHARGTPRTPHYAHTSQRALCAHTNERGAPFERAKCR